MAHCPLLVCTTPRELLCSASACQLLCLPPPLSRPLPVDPTLASRAHRQPQQISQPPAMQLFSGRSKQEHRVGGGGKCHAVAGTAARHGKGGGGKCRALCCGASRLSVSSSASCSSADLAPEPLPLLPPTQPRGLSRLAHGMVQARLQSMIDAAAEAGRPPVSRRSDELAERHRLGLPSGGGGCCYEKGDREQAASRRTCVVLLAEDRRTHDPREEFRRSIAEVIAAKRMVEPAELRALLNCYVSVNAREHRAAILQAFHEVCSALFSCKQLGR